MTIDVVIPTHNARRLVLDCLTRLERAAGEHRVIVVDDASSDGTADAVKRGHSGAEIVRIDHQRGLAHAFNRGTAAGGGELVLFLNNDVFPHERAVERLAQALAADPAATCAGGRLVELGTAVTQASYQPRPLPGLTGLLIRLLGIERIWPRNPWTGRHLTAPLAAEGVQRTDRQPAGACVMVRRSALERIGGWDERYWMWYEDVDLSRRLGKIGPSLYVPDAVFEHVGAASTRRWRKHQQHARLYHGTMIYAQEHLPRTQQVAVALAMVSVCLPRLPFGGREAARSYRALLGQAIRMARFEEVHR